MTEAASPAELRHVPAERRHEELGATFCDFAGWRLPLRYGSEVAEHLAVRSTAGLFDISHMGQIAVVGSKAAAGLAASLVSDVARLEIGAARYTMCCDEQGGVLDDLLVYRTGDARFLVVANAANTARIVAELRSRSPEGDVTVADETGERALFALQGPRAAELLRAACGDALLPGRYRAADLDVAGLPAFVARTGYTGEDGFELSVGAKDAPALWDALLAGDGAGAPVPAGLAARDSLRLEAGLPLYGHELDATRTPFDAGYGNVVDLEHTFVGDAALRRTAEAPSGVALVGLVDDSRRSPRAGYAVYAPEGGLVGAVTSGGPSPSLGGSIAMAYVARPAAVAGSVLEVDVRGRRQPARLVELPFYRRRRTAGGPAQSSAGRPA
ncbi:MAG TPA: glycine cleavage system aminomethyltransferase GcvT [Acidimicrobiales bacterium]|nr:glycine cleavage system aminomethyltransferase GcvT [Acidimicrobiales bacterium]